MGTPVEELISRTRIGTSLSVYPTLRMSGVSRVEKYLDEAVSGLTRGCPLDVTLEGIEQPLTT